MGVDWHIQQNDFVHTLHVTCFPWELFLPTTPQKGQGLDSGAFIDIKRFLEFDGSNSLKSLIGSSFIS